MFAGSQAPCSLCEVQNLRFRSFIHDLIFHLLMCLFSFPAFNHMARVSGVWKGSLRRSWREQL